MYLIFLDDPIFGIIPIITASTIRKTEEWIINNQSDYKYKLEYEKLDYVWK